MIEAREAFLPANINLLFEKEVEDLKGYHPSKIVFSLLDRILTPRLSGEVAASKRVQLHFVELIFNIWHQEASPASVERYILADSLLYTEDKLKEDDLLYILAHYRETVGNFPPHKRGNIIKWDGRENKFVHEVDNLFSYRLVHAMYRWANQNTDTCFVLINEYLMEEEL